MKSYLVTYDLRRQKNYNALYDAIKSYNGWAHVLESTWVIKSDKTATDIRDHIAQSMDKDDGLFVAELSGGAAWRNVNCKHEWLKNNL